MPIRIDNDLPVKQILEEENIFVMAQPMGTLMAIATDKMGGVGVGVSPPVLSTLSFSMQVLVLPERARSISLQSAASVIVCSVGLTEALLVLAKSSVVAMRDDTAVLA